MKKLKLKLVLFAASSFGVAVLVTKIKNKLDELMGEHAKDKGHKIAPEEIKLATGDPLAQFMVDRAEKPVTDKLNY